MPFTPSYLGGSKFIGNGLFQQQPDPRTDVLRDILNYQTRIQSVGAVPPPQENKPPLWLRALDIIDRPRNAIVNAIEDQFITGENSFGRGLWEGFSGQERTYGSDILTQLGVTNKYAKAIGGFLGDVAIDPLSWFGAPIGKAVLGGIKGTGSGMVTSGMKKLGYDLIPTPTKGLGKVGQRIGEVVGKTPIPFTRGAATLGSGLVKAEDQLGPIFKGVHYVPWEYDGAKEMAKYADKLDTRLGKLNTRLGEVTAKGETDKMVRLENAISKMTEQRKYANYTGGRQVLKDASDVLSTLGAKTHSYQAEAKEIMDSSPLAQLLTDEERQLVVKHFDAPIQELYKISKEVGDLKTKVKGVKKQRPKYTMKNLALNGAGEPEAWEVRRFQDLPDAPMHGIFTKAGNVYASTAPDRVSAVDYLLAKTGATVPDIGEFTVANGNVHIHNLPETNSVLEQLLAKGMPFDEAIESPQFFRAARQGFQNFLRELNASDISRDFTMTIDPLGERALRGMDFPNKISHFLGEYKMLTPTKQLTKRQVALAIKHFASKEGVDKLDELVKKANADFAAAEVGSKGYETMRRRVRDYTGAQQVIRMAYKRAGEQMEQAVGPDLAKRQRIMDSIGFVNDRSAQLAERDAIPRAEQLPSYLHRVYEEDPRHVENVLSNRQLTKEVLGTGAGWKKERTFLTDELAEKKTGLTVNKNPYVRQAIREMDSAKIQARRDVIEELQRIPDMIVPEDKIPMNGINYKKLINSKELRGFVVHPQVEQMMNQLDNLMFNDDNLTSALRLVDKMQNWWKTSVTAVRPGWYVQNFLGNIFNNALAGIYAPEPYMLAMKAQAGKNIDEALMRLRIIHPDGSYMTTKEFTDLFKEHGLEGFGEFFGDIKMSVREWARQRAKDVGRSKASVELRHPIQTARSVGNAMESNAKMAHFLDRLARGYSVEDAALSVKKYLFDYTDLSKTERNVFRRILPFYTWTRKNLPLQLEHIFTKPQQYLAVLRIQQNAASGFDQDISSLPDWMSERAIATPWQNKFLMPSLPSQSLTDASDPGRTLLAMLSPFLRTPMEAVTNQSFFSGQPIERYEGQRGEVMGQDMSAKLAYALNQLTGVKEASGAISSARDDSATTAPLVGGPVLGQFSKAIIRGYDPSNSELYGLYEYNQRLRDYLRVLKDQGIEVPTIADLERGGGLGKWAQMR